MLLIHRMRRFFHSKTSSRSHPLPALAQLVSPTFPRIPLPPGRDTLWPAALTACGSEQGLGQVVSTDLLSICFFHCL